MPLSPAAPQTPPKAAQLSWANVLECLFGLHGSEIKKAAKMKQAMQGLRLWELCPQKIMKLQDSST